MRSPPAPAVDGGHAKNLTDTERMKGSLKNSVRRTRCAPLNSIDSEVSGKASSNTRIKI